MAKDNTGASPLAHESPSVGKGNSFFRPESGPAIKELQKNRESEGSHLDWDSGGHQDNYKRSK